MAARGRPFKLPEVVVRVVKWCVSLTSMRRTIKSFVLRTGRVSKRQQLALEQWLQDYELPLSATPWNLVEIFGRQAPTVVEIGFGMGASLLAMAKANPHINFIGIEVHRAGLGSLAADLHDLNLSNVRVVAADAMEVFKAQVPDGALAGLQIFFPDPWHKKKHHKRRLIQSESVSLFADKLLPGGFLHCATDWEDYALHMSAVLAQEPKLRNAETAGGFAPRPKSRPVTKFELRGERLGHGVWDLIFIRSACLNEAEAIEFRDLFDEGEGTS